MPALVALNLVSTPVLAGLVVGAITVARGWASGRWAFGCGFLFALAFALVRWSWAQP